MTPEFIRSKKAPIEIIVIAGPTASGKSRRAIEIARKNNGAIINSDSRQVYRDLVIGTAQPVPDRTTEEGVWMIEEIPHYLYGFVDFHENFTLYDYQKAAKLAIKQVSSKGMTPILVGGTGLFIDSIVYDYQLPKNEDCVEKLKREELTKLSLPELQSLAGKEFHKLNDSDRMNPRRLIRVIERGSAEIKKGNALGHIYHVLSPSDSILDNNITKRTEQMFSAGLVEENIALRKKGYDFSSKKVIGYTEFAPYPILEKPLSVEEIKSIKSEINLHTRQYAKRQMTWFKKAPGNL